MMTLPPNVSKSAPLAPITPIAPVFTMHSHHELAAVAVVIVAYNAEHTIADVLSRIPRTFAENVGAILVSDDASSDATVEVARRWAASHPLVNLTVVHQEKNLGYGGNQKFCYRWALDHGHHIAVMVHGDGQYAPELVGSMIEPLLRGETDAVFGSRMLTPGGARRGGMPMYKWVGNRILTTIQNGCAGLKLSEWHSGYRAYSVAALRDVPFRANADGYHFDTQIIIQFHEAGKRIKEIPIPTYYGDEICHVNGLEYAKDVVVDTVRYRLGRSGFGSGRLGHVAEPYAFKPSPYSSHGRILQMVEQRPRMRILDVGCGPGWLAKALTDLGHEVVGIDLEAADGIADRMSSFVQADLSEGIPEEVGGDFDLVLAADVIEHLANPERLLADMAARVRPRGSIIASVPNISHWYPRFRITAGRFDYDQRGVLDATHLRFFTRRRFLRVAEESGLEQVAFRHTGLPLDALGLSRSPAVTGTIGRADRLLVKAWPTMFAYQFVYEFTPWRGGALRNDMPQ